MNVIESVNQALKECLQEEPRVWFLGEDVLDPYGGAFKAARGLSTSYPDRVMTTPVSEAGIVGLGVGMALRGFKPVVEIMFGDFIMLAADQLVNHAAKLRWMSNGQARVPLVVRTPMGGGRGYGPTHSQSLEKHLLGTPGLTVVAISALGDPVAVLKHAVLKHDDPVLVIEHKRLYTRPVLSLDELDEFSVYEEGDGFPTYRLAIQGAPSPRFTLAAYGFMAELAREAALRLAYEHELFAELIVPTRLAPADWRPLRESIQATHRLVAIEEGARSLGWGSEVIASALEWHGSGLAARRVAAKDQPVPAAGPLEEAMLPQVDDIVDGVLDLAAQD